MNIRFAVVDDAAFLRELIKNVLQSEGALCVAESADGQNVLDLVQKTLPDLVVLDMVLPHSNGIEIAKNLKNEIPHVKILGCSTLDSEDILMKAKEAGIDGYLVKPFSKSQLIEEIKKLIK